MMSAYSTVVTLAAWLHAGTKALLKFLLAPVSNRVADLIARLGSPPAKVSLSRSQVCLVKQPYFLPVSMRKQKNTAGLRDYIIDPCRFGDLIFFLLLFM